MVWNKGKGDDFCQDTIEEIYNKIFAISEAFDAKHLELKEQLFSEVRAVHISLNSEIKELEVVLEKEIQRVVETTDKESLALLQNLDAFTKKVSSKMERVTIQQVELKSANENSKQILEENKMFREATVQILQSLEKKTDRELLILENKIKLNTLYRENTQAKFNTVINAIITALVTGAIGIFTVGINYYLNDTSDRPQHKTSSSIVEDKKVK